MARATNGRRSITGASCRIELSDTVSGLFGDDDCDGGGGGGCGPLNKWCGCRWLMIGVAITLISDGFVFVFFEDLCQGFFSVLRFLNVRAVFLFSCRVRLGF